MTTTWDHLATPATAALARSEHIDTDVKFPDHAPITVDYDRPS